MKEYSYLHELSLNDHSKPYISWNISTCHPPGAFSDIARSTRISYLAPVLRHTVQCLTSLDVPVITIKQLLSLDIIKPRLIHTHHDNHHRTSPTSLLGRCHCWNGVKYDRKRLFSQLGCGASDGRKGRGMRRALANGCKFPPDHIFINQALVPAQYRAEGIGKRGLVGCSPNTGVKMVSNIIHMRTWGQTIDDFAVQEQSCEAGEV